MPACERDVALPDGRILRVLEDGDPRGRPVFVLHGTPGCRRLYSRHVEDAARRGLRLIGYDRPGYGGSSPKPGRRKLDAAADVAAIADALGLDRFAVWGHSGGGPLAIACAARLPARVVAASSLAAVAPYQPEVFDWTQGMGELNVVDWNLMLSDPTAWEAKMAQEAKELEGMPWEQVVEFMSTLLSDVDRAAMTPELGEFLQHQMREGLRSSIEGAKEDSLSDAAPWGFDLSEIVVPLQLWHGRHDRFVPFSHGEWLAAHLPRAEIHLESAEGHASLFQRRIPEVHEWLADRF